MNFSEPSHQSTFVFSHTSLSYQIRKLSYKFVVCEII